MRRQKEEAEAKKARQRERKEKDGVPKTDAPAAKEAGHDVEKIITFNHASMCLGEAAAGGGC